MRSSEPTRRRRSHKVHERLVGGTGKDSAVVVDLTNESPNKEKKESIIDLVVGEEETKKPSSTKSAAKRSPSKLVKGTALKRTNKATPKVKGSSTKIPSDYSPKERAKPSHQAKSGPAAATKKRQKAAAAAATLLQQQQPKAQYVYPLLKVAKKPYNLESNPHLSQMLADFETAYNNDKPSVSAYKISSQETGSVYAYFKSTSKVGYAFSNFFRALVVLDVRDPTSNDGINGTYAFSSSEHAYQWACRVFPVDNSKSTLLKWTVGGEAETGVQVKKQAIGLAAKLRVSKTNALRLPNLAQGPVATGMPLEDQFKTFWQPILTAKYTQTKRLREALQATVGTTLVEFSRSFYQKKLGGHVKDGGASFVVPSEASGAMMAEWRKNMWAGAVIQHPNNESQHQFGYNVMGNFIMRIRTHLFSHESSENPHKPWTNNL